VKHFDIKITGHVQGVWYRGSALRKARELGLTGFVRNLPDGSVYAEAEGSEEVLRAFVAWCRQGPPLAEVENVEVMESGALKNFETFEVVR
jgi:acylphosphatase